MNVRLNRDRSVAVDLDYYWQPMSTCPLGVKVQMLTTLGVAVYGNYSGNQKGWDGWAPLPKRMKNA